MYRRTSNITAVEERGGRLYAGDVPVWEEYGGRVGRDALFEYHFSPSERLHPCAVCQSRFIAHFECATCSEACQKALAAKTRHEWRAKRKSAERPTLELKCQRCGGGFTGLRRSGRFCSPACKQAEWRSSRTAKRSDGQPIQT